MKSAKTRIVRWIVLCCIPAASHCVFAEKPYSAKIQRIHFQDWIRPFRTFQEKRVYRLIPSSPVRLSDSLDQSAPDEIIDSTRTINWAKAAIQIAGGVGGGLLGALIVGFPVSAAYKKNEPENSGWGVIIGAMFLGYAMGSIVSVYTVGEATEMNGSFLMTALGGIAGCLIMPPLGAMLFYNLSCGDKD
jgi:hypothetical protein